MRIRKRQMIAWGVCIMFVGMVGVYGLVWLTMSEEIESTRGTLKWRLTIWSSVIRNFPVIEPSDEPRFSSWAHSGTQPAADVIEYKSNAPIDRVVSMLDEYLRQAGCVAQMPETPSDDSRSYLHDGSRVELYIWHRSPERKVEVWCIYLR